MCNVLIDNVISNLSNRFQQVAEYRNNAVLSFEELIYAILALGAIFKNSMVNFSLV